MAPAVMDPARHPNPAIRPRFLPGENGVPCPSAVWLVRSLGLAFRGYDRSGVGGTKLAGPVRKFRRPRLGTAEPSLALVYLSTRQGHSRTRARLCHQDLWR